MELTELLKTSPSAYHTAANCERELKEKGFVRLYEGEPWKINRGGKYYCVKNGSCVVAFVVGSLTEYSFMIAESHTDSPSLKVKGNVLIDSPEGKRINVEKYGGGLLYSMMNIPLKIAGRIFVKSEKGLVSELVCSSYNVNIPGLCIHHAPETNDGLSLNVQTDMLPLLGDADDLYSTLTDKEVVDADLFVSCDIPPCATGADGEFLVAPRIDNLTSVFSSIEAICACEPSGVAVCACFDNEEVGSLTKQGAQSAFLPNVLKKINAALGFDETDFERALKNGFVLSVDNGHAIHPAHPEKSDVVNKTVLGGGVVIKHHVNYSTDGLSSAVVKMLLERNGIKYQEYYNRSDLRCGSTLGLMSSAQLAVNACDVGIAQLAMHSAIETAKLSDVEEMTRFLRAFYDSSFKFADDGTIEIV